MSSAANTSLKEYEDTISGTSLSTESMAGPRPPEAYRMDVMSAVSTIWLNMVEPLLRSHRCRPLVTRRQKWKSDTSTDWATR